MRIYSIDPGNEQSAYVIWNGYKIIDKGIEKNEDLLYLLRISDIMAIEMMASYGMPVGKTTFDTCLWIGRFCQKYLDRWNNVKFEDKIKLIYRKDVKMHFCHSIKGVKDTNIRQALIDRFGEPGTKKNKGLLYGVTKDIWSALSIGVYTYDIFKNNL